MEQEKKVIGHFNAVTFDNQVYEFIVKDDLLIYCDTIIKKLGIRKLILKPNFEAILDKNGWISCDCLSRVMVEGK